MNTMKHKLFVLENVGKSIKIVFNYKYNPNAFKIFVLSISVLSNNLRVDKYQFFQWDENYIKLQKTYKSNVLGIYKGVNVSKPL